MSRDNIEDMIDFKTGRAILSCSQISQLDPVSGVIVRWTVLRNETNNMRVGRSTNVLKKIGNEKQLQTFNPNKPLSFCFRLLTCFFLS